MIGDPMVPFFFQSSMQGTNTILKVMKQSASLTIITLPNYFWNELCRCVAIFTNPHIFSSFGLDYQELCLPSPDAIASFSLQ